MGTNKYNSEDLFLEFGGSASHYDCERVFSEVIKPLQDNVAELTEVLKEIAKEVIVAHQNKQINAVGYQIRNPKAIYEAIKKADKILQK